LFGAKKITLNDDLTYSLRARQLLKLSKTHCRDIEKEDRCNDDYDDDDDDDDYYGDTEQACLCVHIHIQSSYNMHHPMEQFNSSTA